MARFNSPRVPTMQTSGEGRDPMRRMAPSLAGLDDLLRIPASSGFSRGWIGGVPGRMMGIPGGMP